MAKSFISVNKSTNRYLTRLFVNTHCWLNFNFTFVVKKFQILSLWLSSIAMVSDILSIVITAYKPWYSTSFNGICSTVTSPVNFTVNFIESRNHIRPDFPVTILISHTTLQGISLLYTGKSFWDRTLRPYSITAHISFR